MNEYPYVDLHELSLQTGVETQRNQRQSNTFFETCFKEKIPMLFSITKVQIYKYIYEKKRTSFFQRQCDFAIHECGSFRDGFRPAFLVDDFHCNADVFFHVFSVRRGRARLSRERPAGYGTVL